MNLYISSNEYEDFSNPREIINWENVTDSKGNCLIVKFDKPVKGDDYGFPKNLHQFLLVGRFDDYKLKGLKEFPIEVHVFVIENINQINEIGSLKELTNIAWASVYNDFKDALNHAL